MSNKTNLKRIALLGISALGLGLLCVVPANAAAISAVTIENMTSVTNAVSGTAEDVDFEISSNGGDTDDSIVYSLSISKPTGSSVAIAAPGAGAAGAATYKLRTGNEAALAGDWALTTVGNTRVDTALDDGVDLVTEIRGTISLNPDVAGTYVITLSAVATPDGEAALAAVTKTWTVIVPTVNDTTFSTTSLNITRYTAVPTVNSAVAFNLGGVFATVATIDITDSTDFAGALTSYPVGGYVGVTAAATTAAGDAVEDMDDMNPAGASASGPVLKRASQDNNFEAVTVTSSRTVGIGSFSFTPVIAGDYVLTIWNDKDQDGVIDLAETRQTIGVTITAAAAFSAGLTTSIRDTANSFDATVDEEVRVSSAVETNGASIELTILDTAGNGKGGMLVTAEVSSGPGLVDVQTGLANAYEDATVRADSLQLAAGVSGATIHVTADGTAGTGTITIKVKDPDSLAVLGTYTETVYFFGTLASLTATANFTVARASATQRGCSSATTCDQATFADTPFIQIVAKDADGNLIPGLALTADISDASVIQASTVTAVTSTAVSGADALTACVSTDCNGLGYYNASLAGSVTATSGKSATISYKSTIAGTTTVIKSNAITITIGGSAATGTETLTLDKSSYEQGEGMTVTLTAKDSAGNPVYDGYASPAVTFNKAIGGTAIAASYYVGGKVTSNDSLGRQTVYAPTASGAFTATATAASLATLTATATVGDDAATTAATAASDAANEATDAANAATDAANAAAEAADAATAAAQDAQAAVADLAAQVATLIAGIKSQLTSLSNLIVKIQKKVKA